MPVTPTDVDNAVPVGGTPSRSLTNAVLKGFITDIFNVSVGVGTNTVNTFADLPAASTATGQRWWVLNSSGVWLVNRQPKGAYYSNGTTWSYLGDFPVTATEVGFTPTANIASTNTQAAIEETYARFTQRVSSTPSVVSPLAWNSNNFDMYAVTGQTTALTINADSGTPTNGRRILFRIQDNGTPRALTWTTGVSKGFRAIGITLPTTTVASKVIYVGCVFNAIADRWDAIAFVQEA